VSTFTTSPRETRSAKLDSSRVATAFACSIVILARTSGLAADSFSECLMGDFKIKPEFVQFLGIFFLGQLHS